jgi:hypothetical protein
MLMTAYQNKNKLAMIALLLVLTFVIVPAVNAQGAWYQVRITNSSRYAIRSIYMSPTSNRYWGPDLLGSQVLVPGYVLTTHPLQAGYYDLKLVDQDGDQCVVRGVSVDPSSSWTITNAWLVHCEGY